MLCNINFFAQKFYQLSHFPVLDFPKNIMIIRYFTPNPLKGAVTRQTQVTSALFQSQSPL
jgi:hypothetical protein